MPLRGPRALPVERPWSAHTCASLHLGLAPGRGARLHHLVLEDFAQELRRKNRWQGLETLQLIRDELIAPFKSLRPPYQPLSYESAAAMLALRVGNRRVLPSAAPPPPPALPVVAPCGGGGGGTDVGGHS